MSADFDPVAAADEIRGYAQELDRLAAIDLAIDEIPDFLGGSPAIDDVRDYINEVRADVELNMEQAGKDWVDQGTRWDIPAEIRDLLVEHLGADWNK